MILGIGNDLVEISRIERLLSQYGSHFLDRHFTSREQAYCAKYARSATHYAGRFAAKEAIVKALGFGIREGLGWLDVEIVNDELGKPVVYLDKKVTDRFGDLVVHVSITHGREIASAFAVAEKIDLPKNDSL